jgi:hypothetical protein
MNHRFTSVPGLGARLVLAFGAVAVLGTVLSGGVRDAQAQAGSAPMNWGDDASTVALWTFDGNGYNVSNTRTYCATGEADLTRFWNQSGGLSFDTGSRRQGSASVSLDGMTTLAAQSSVNNTRCLRQDSPNTWTMTFWMRNTAVNTRTSSPYPMLIFNRDEAAVGANALNGFYVTYVNTGAGGTGNTYACTRGTNDSSDSCTPTIIGGVAPSPNWRFGAVQYTGTGLKYALEGAAFGPGTTHKLGKNPGTYPFQLSHVVNPGNESGVIGNLDEVWWTSAVLTQPQVCRVRSVGVQGSLGWCDGAAWKSCNSNADCGGRSGACNTAFASGGMAGTCVGQLSASGATDCNSVASLGSCNAVLTSSVIPAPTLLSVDPVLP